MADWNMITALATVALSVITLVLGIFAIVQLRLVRQGIRLQSCAMEAQSNLTVLHEWMFELWDARGQAASAIGELERLARTVPAPPLTKLSSPLSSAIRLSHFFDQLGLLIIAGQIDENLAISFLGGAATYWWNLLWPFIEEERKLRNDRRYQEYFEDLVRRAMERAPSVRLQTRRIIGP